MAITLIPSERQQTQHIFLEGVTWATYQALLNELGEHRASRLAYAQGVLEIIMPSDLHEFINRILEAIIRALAEELNMRLRGYGSTTLAPKFSTWRRTGLLFLHSECRPNFGKKARSSDIPTA